MSFPHLLDVFHRASREPGSLAYPVLLARKCEAASPKPCGCISAVACVCVMSESGQNIVVLFSVVGVPTGETAYW